MDLLLRGFLLNTNLSNLVLLFTLLGQLLISEHRCLADVLEKSFTKVNGPIYGSERLGPAWPERYLSGCGVNCWVRYGSRCQTILYNSDTGLCTPGSFLKSGTFGAALAPTSTEGDLFAPSVCDTSDGFTYVTSASASACIKVSNFTLTYFDAYAHCLKLGAHLYVANTWEKFNLLPLGNDFTLGLTDIALEGKMVWQNTGEEIAHAFKVVFFSQGEPSNGYGIEDCVAATVGPTSHVANDVPCDLDRFKFVCERPMII